MKAKVKPLLFLLFVYISFVEAESNFYVSIYSNLTTNCGETTETACGTIQAGVDAACDANTTDTKTVWVGPGKYSIVAIDVGCPLSLK